MPTKDESESRSPTIPDDLIAQLLGGYKKPEDLTGPNGLIKQLVAKLVTRAMNTELDHHLGYEPGESPPEGQTKSSQWQAQQDTAQRCWSDPDRGSS